MLRDSAVNLAFYETVFVERGYERREDVAELMHDHNAALLQELCAGKDGHASRLKRWWNKNLR